MQRRLNRLQPNGSTATIPNTDLHAAGRPELITADQHRAEVEQARRLAERYRLEFIDMETFRIDQDLFRSIPADLMLRYGFVPYRRVGKSLEIVVSDPIGPADDRRAERAAVDADQGRRSARGPRSNRS